MSHTWHELRESRRRGKFIRQMELKLERKLNKHYDPTDELFWPV